jgi:post-segregation antitoxin (ccd killing protein)
MMKPTDCDPLRPDAIAWPKANREAILSSNAWIEDNGLPLQDYRLF